MHQDDLTVRSCRGSRSWGCFSGSAPLAFPNPVRILPGRDASAVSLNHRSKAEKLEHEQQRELWDWNTMKPTGIFGFVWEQAMGEGEERALRPL